jgi:1-hydroxycarotenoid 3,4-desaturase
MRDPGVIVIGAGIGGLTAALLLAARGLRVTLLERAATPGGKMRELGAGAARGDARPTVFTMRWVFDELLAEVGESLEARLTLEPLAVLARHAWDRDRRFDLFADLERSVDAIGDFAGAAEARRYRAFCARAQDVYRALERPFLRAPRPNPLTLVGRGGWRGLPGMLRIAPFRTLWQELGRHFHDPRLRQLFARYATYCGASPWFAPATLMLVAHVEREGVWRVTGGMQRVAAMLEGLAQQRGTTLRYGAEVRRIVVRSGRACGVELADGETLAADAVVFNGDPCALAQGLLGEAARHAVATRATQPRSLSAITWNLAARTHGFPLAHHSVFFGADYAEEFDAVFRRGTLPEDPTVYVCAQDRGGNDTAPAGSERLLCLVNAPARGDGQPFSAEEIDACEQRTFRRLAACGLQVARTPTSCLRTTPSDFHRLFPGTGGALYGAASHGWQASFRRPTQRTAISGLVLAGGGTHPGPGVPMAALSGRSAAAQVLAQLATQHASTWAFPPAGTPGGTSTR